MSFWSAAAPSLIEGGFSAAGNRFSERENRQATRRAQDWAMMMAGTEVRRRVEDLQAAGLNPMLAYSDSASTPNVPPAQVPDYGSVARGTGSAYAQNKLMLAQARKTNAEAALIEPKGQYSAFNAKTESDILDKQSQKLSEELEATKVNWQKVLTDKDLVDWELENMRPLMKEYQEIQNRLLDAGLAGKEIEKEMFEKYPLLKQFRVFMESIRGGK